MVPHNTCSESRPGTYIEVCSFSTMAAIKANPERCSVFGKRARLGRYQTAPPPVGLYRPKLTK